LFPLFGAEAVKKPFCLLQVLISPTGLHRIGVIKGLLRREHRGIAFNHHLDMEGVIVYRHACALGREGIVSKRLGSPYWPGRSDCWLKIKNPAAPAVRRLEEEDWL